jgi:hypothetical protein
MPPAGAAPRAPEDAPPWASRMVHDLVSWTEWTLRGPFRLTRYAKASLPALAAQDAGATAWCTDDATFPRQVWWTGTGWVRSDNSTVA